MSSDDSAHGGLPTGSGPIVATITIVAVPLVALAVLRLRSRLDVVWENHPAHFWLVLTAAAIAMSLGRAVYAAARARQDARVLLISLALLSGSGFLGLHALATPGVLVGPNAGFEVATPVGLVLGSAFVALSTVEMRPATSMRLMARSPLMLGALLGVMLLWVVVSVAEWPPLNDPLQQEALQGWQIGFALLGVAGYGTGAVGYLRLHQHRGGRFLFAVAVAFGLLAASMVVIAFAANWRLSWWQWHVLMLVSFGLMALASRREWHQERFNALYLQHTLSGTREASILFADLQGFTSFSERNPPQQVQGMLNAYLSRLIPLMTTHHGEVHQLIGDAVMVVFNRQGDRPDHALQAARAALAFQQTAAEIGSAHPQWPRFRVGVNSGDVAMGMLGERGHRKFDVIGDSVNLAARLESQAPVGEVVIGEGTRQQLPDDAVVERLPPLELKGKSQPTTAYLLRSLPS